MLVCESSSVLQCHIVTAKCAPHQADSTTACKGVFLVGQALVRPLDACSIVKHGHVFWREFSLYIIDLTVVSRNTT
jgi:hypothetical protein